jgi:CheY-like chemotaxis protein
VTIEVVRDLGEIPAVMGNASALREVLMNLIFNAVDAMPHGGVLGFRTWAERGRVRLSVSDTGVGMDEETRRKCFDPFFTTKGVGNSGLGLAVSYSIVQEHEGEISVRSRPGAGTTFDIELPLVAVEVGEARPEEQSALPSMRILVVDDELAVLEAVSGLLELGGHRVTVAGGGQEALGILEQDEFGVLITDLGMPGMNGWEVAEEAKARWPGMPVLLLTGWGQRLEEDERLRYIDGVAAKPVRLKDLESSLRAVLEPSDGEPVMDGEAVGGWSR